MEKWLALKWKWVLLEKERFRGGAFCFLELSEGGGFTFSICLCLDHLVHVFTLADSLKSQSRPVWLTSKCKSISSYCLNNSCILMESIFKLKIGVRLWTLKYIHLTYMWFWSESIWQSSSSTNLAAGDCRIITGSRPTQNKWQMRFCGVLIQSDGGINEIQWTQIP